jgi:hypothetical protein
MIKDVIILDVSDPASGTDREGKRSNSAELASPT